MGIPPKTVEAIPDDDSDKRFPNGIVATFLAIQNYWLNLTRGLPEGLSAGQFARAGFRDVYRSVIKKYGAIGKRPNPDNDNAVKKMLQRLGNQEIDLEFFHLRSFAEFVDLPTGLLLLFTQMVSDERRMLEKGHSMADTRDFLRDFIISAEEALKAAREMVEQRKGERIFTYAYDEAGTKHMARAKTLKAWSDAFNCGPYPARKAAIWPEESKPIF